MTEIINYLFEAYATHSAFEIVLECLAFGFGIISVIYAKRENILVYPTGITCTLITMYFMFSERLIGHMMVNFFYTLMSVYGCGIGLEKKMMLLQSKYQSLVLRTYQKLP